MAAGFRMKELNQLKKDTVLFEQGSPVRCIGIVIKGSVMVQSGGIRRIAGKGAMLGVSDLFFQEYLGDYIVTEDTFFYAFPAASAGEWENFLESNPDYRGIAVHSAAVEFAEYVREKEALCRFAADLKGYFEQNHVTEELAKEDTALPFQKAQIANYRETAKVPLEIHKKYYFESREMALYQTEQISGMTRAVLQASSVVNRYLENCYRSMADEDLYEPGALFGIAYLKRRFLQLQKIQEENRKAKAEALSVPLEKLMEVLKDSMLQILKFAGIAPKDQKEIIASVQAFVDEKDRMSTQDEIRKIKKQITTYFFQIYQNCVFRWFDNASVPIAVQLFLNYGYLDERLLDEEQIRFLYMQMQETHDKLECRIYTMPEWLKEIYEGRKEPSRNNFEQDYRDFLREEKRTGKITEKQEAEYLEDNRRKVIFEIENMFTSNNKIVNGKLSTYVPILYKDEIYGHLDRLYLSKKQICDEIIELEKKDFTIFQREVLYTNPELKIDKEYVIKRVYPDVILTPVYGTASSMWQEITGKKRDTPGRFIFPVIAEGELDKLVTKAFGRFHWEYCRCEQGASWNNIQYKSLTSEYMDYIQYYRKNHDLTEEKREKIKAQILKARNNSREIFLIDYELWIYYESKAALKLNKVARLILAAYCPFNKEIREMLKSNAAFADALMAHQKIFGEKKREWEMRIKRRENKNLEVPQEFYDTYRYYADN